MVFLSDALWFEVAIVSIVFTIGNILMGHFEEHTPKAKRIAKYLMFLILICGLSYYFGRMVAMTVLGISFLPTIYIHTILLPKKGINGWTGEPKEKYYKMRGWDLEKLYRNRPK